MPTAAPKNAAAKNASQVRSSSPSSSSSTTTKAATPTSPSLKAPNANLVKNAGSAVRGAPTNTGMAGATKKNATSPSSPTNSGKNAGSTKNAGNTGNSRSGSGNGNARSVKNARTVRGRYRHLTPEQEEKLRACKKDVWKGIMDDCADKGKNCHIVKTCSEQGFKLPNSDEPLIGSKLWPLGEYPRDKEQEINKLYNDPRMFRKAMKCVGKRVNEKYGTRFGVCYEGLPSPNSNSAKKNSSNNSSAKKNNASSPGKTNNSNSGAKNPSSTTKKTAGRNT